MSKKLKQTYFAETWLEDPNFKNWIAKGQDSSVQVKIRQNSLLTLVDVSAHCTYNLYRV